MRIRNCDVVGPISTFCAIFTHADGSREARVFAPFCLSVSLCFRTISQKPMQITKLDIDMFHDESWKTIYFGPKVEGRARVTKILPA